MNHKNLMLRLQDAINRRSFLSNGAGGLGLAALAGLASSDAHGERAAHHSGGLPGLPHWLPKPNA